MKVEYYKPMTPQQLGAYAEKMFEDIITKKYGKEAYLYRFPDTKDIRNRGVGESVAWIKKQPSDYLLVRPGIAMFTEIKSTENTTSFSLSKLRPEQVSTLKQLKHAHGNYAVLILRRVKNPTTGYYIHLWYYLDRDFILPQLTLGKKTIPFNTIGDKLWNLGNAYLANAQT